MEHCSEDLCLPLLQGNRPLRSATVASRSFLPRLRRERKIHASAPTARLPALHGNKDQLGQDRNGFLPKMLEMQRHRRNPNIQPRHHQGKSRITKQSDGAEKTKTSPAVRGKEDEMRRRDRSPGPTGKQMEEQCSEEYRRGYAAAKADVLAI